MKIDGPNGAGQGFLPLEHVPKKAEIVEVDRGGEDDRKLRDACRNFEALFLHHLLRTMRNSIPEGGLLEVGAGEKVFRDMMDEALAKRISERGGIGLSRMLYDHLTSSHD